MNQALLSSKNMNWCTPQDFYDKLDLEFSFVLDAAATNETAKCQRYYTPETDLAAFDEAHDLEHGLKHIELH